MRIIHRGALNVTDGKGRVLRILGKIIVWISLVTQIVVIAIFWWQFDPRTSCDRLIYWGEWIKCMHGQSHIYVVFAEMAVSAWLAAGVGMLLARFLPVYASAI